MTADPIQDILEEYRRKSADVDYGVRLPDAEFDVMMAVWSFEPPVTSRMVMQLLGENKGWKLPTLISFLTRLEDRGYILSYKKGKERYYIPIAEKEPYIAALTKKFVETVHSGSFVQFLDAYFSGREFTDADIDALLCWLKER